MEKVLHLLNPEHKRKFPNNDIIHSEDHEGDFLIDLRPKIPAVEEMKAAKPAGVAVVLACDAYLQEMVAPNLADIDAAKAAVKVAADTLWPPP